MDFCKTVELLYAALPLRPLRDWLIRAHMEACPRCQGRLLSREEARTLMVGPGEVGESGALWQRISREAGRAVAVSEAGPRGGSPAWRWAAVTAMTAVLALAGFWLLRTSGEPGRAARAILPADRFEIAYVKVGGEPARTFVYQPQGTETVFVWAQKTP